MLILLTVFEKRVLEKVMRKHFTGIALFIFIVGISGFVASLFNEIPKPEIFEVQNTVPVYESRTRCSKKYRDNEQFQVKINQVVYDEETGQLSANYMIRRGQFSANSVPVYLHFFVKTANRTQHLVTEKATLTPTIIENNEYGNAHFYFKFLANLKSHENLYVIAESQVEQNNGYSGETKNSPVFDESKATAVLVEKN